MQEWADVASRDSAAPFLQQLVALDPNRESDSTHMDLDSSAEDDEAPGLQLAGNSGDGMFEAAVVQLVAAMQGSTDGFMAAMLDGIADLAAAAGLLRKPASDVDDGAGQQQWTFTGRFINPWRVESHLCCPILAQLMLTGRVLQLIWLSKGTQQNLALIMHACCCCCCFCSAQLVLLTQAKCCRSCATYGCCCSGFPYGSSRWQGQAPAASALKACGSCFCCWRSSMTTHLSGE